VLTLHGLSVIFLSAFVRIFRTVSSAPSVRAVNACFFLRAYFHCRFTPTTISVDGVDRAACLPGIWWNGGGSRAADLAHPKILAWRPICFPLHTFCESNALRSVPLLLHINYNLSLRCASIVYVCVVLVSRLCYWTFVGS